MMELTRAYNRVMDADDEDMWFIFASTCGLVIWLIVGVVSFISDGEWGMATLCAAIATGLIYVLTIMYADIL
jgi:hypothetical protein